MRRLRGLLRAADLRAHITQAAALDVLTVATDALRADMRELQATVGSLTTQIEAAQHEHRRLLKSWRHDAEKRARLAAAPGPALLADSLWVDGLPHRRAVIRRLTVGAWVEKRFDAWMGVTRCLESSREARALWESLLASESEASGGTLRSAPGAILDLGAAVIWRREPNAGQVLLLDAIPPKPTARVVAVPRFAYSRMPRKLRNFGHWVLDYLPQVVALASVAPDAEFLLPDPVARFQRATLALVGITDERMRPWNGEPVSAERLLVLENDGRLGGGRPLSLLIETHKVLQLGAPAAKARRRLYVSRRDAKHSRRWVSNQEAVESLFASRGFEVLLMATCPLEEQVDAFRDAHIVAGVSGAGLSDIVFSAAGTHLIVLHSDSLMQWYAVENRPRSHWTDADRVRGGELAELGDSPRFYAHLAATLSQYCHSFLSADEMPIAALATFLDEVLQRAEQATCDI